MASSGSFTGARPLQYSPQLILEWQTISQDIPNNRSRVRLTLKLYSQYNISFSATKSGSLHGSSFSYSGGMSGTNQTRTIATRELWVNHNSDGTKSQSFSASFNIAINWGGNWLSSLSVSGTANLDQIPRASSISSFSNFSLRSNQTNSFNLSLSRASSSFTHDITLRVGSTNIQTWTGQGLPSSLTLSSSSSNQILNIMRNTTSTTAQLRVQTKSGSTNIGSVVTRNATVSVHSSVAPTINSISVSEQVSNIASDLGEYVQYHSRLAISVSTSAGYGARDSSTRITVNGQTFNSKTAMTATLKSSGTNTVAVRYTNTRGQVVNDSRTITVRQYSPPQPSITKAYRSDEGGNENDEGEYATVEFNNSISSINGQNTGVYQIKYKRADVSYFDEETTPSSGSYTFPADVDYGYDIQVVVSDYFDTRTAYDSVTSTFSLINFAPDGRGLAFGGTYDESVGGIAQFHRSVAFTGGINSLLLPEGADLNDIQDVGFYRCHTNSRASTMHNLPQSSAFSLLVERHAGVKQTFTRYHNSEPRTWIRNLYSGTWGDWFEIQFK